MNSHGYIYTGRDDVDPVPPELYAADIGAILHTSRCCIVAYHEIATIHVSSWPGRLLRVKIVEVDREGMADPALVANPGYTRCLAVQIVEELAPWLVFGPDGAGVAEVIEVAQRLSLDQVTRLARHDSPEAAEIYSAAFQRWMDVQPYRSGSPVHSGFSTIHHELWKRARVVSGDAATELDDDETPHLAEPWDEASSVLMHAAMALGAPSLVPEGGQELLLCGWRSLATG